MIEFTKPFIHNSAYKYILQSLESGKISGDEHFTKLAHQFLNSFFGCTKSLLTTSGTHSLEMAALASDVTADDEIICPSFTFSSTANAFALRGSKLVFVDIESDTMNICPQAIEAAITKKTKVICIVHYAGVPCKMKEILELTKKHNLILIEDMAQSFGSTYKDQLTGTFGQFGCISFHATKNISCGEGGALLINDSKYSLKSEIIREKGTNRSQFLRGSIDKYTWQDLGSSYLPSDINAALLLSQLENYNEIQNLRLLRWNQYYLNLKDLELRGLLKLPNIPSDVKHNGHIFFLKLADLKQREELRVYLKSHNIVATFHYIPLHSSPAGLKYGRFAGKDVNTTIESERLLRLPLYSGMTKENCDLVCEKIRTFFV
jgi:dTDP-4-amino-4,6-dideoxygalactose transaminase